MQAAPSLSSRVDSQIFTDGWGPDWQQPPEQPAAGLASILSMPQLYRPALALPPNHPTFAAAVLAAGSHTGSHFHWHLAPYRSPFVRRRQRR
jgi:hypothetical protein